MKLKFFNNRVARSQVTSAGRVQSRPATEFYVANHRLQQRRKVEIQV